jgi:hypothetical protein
MKHLFIAMFCFAAAAVVSSCSLTVPHQIVSAGPGVYLASAGGGPYTMDVGSVRESAYKAANDFCTRKGLVMVPVEETERSWAFARHTSSFTLRFRALPKEEAAKWDGTVKHTVLD